jgi:hypothetical protein
LKLSGENIGRNLHDTGLGHDNKIPGHKSKINKWDDIEPYKFCITNKNNQWGEKTALGMEQNVYKTYIRQWIISRTYKELL